MYKNKRKRKMILGSLLCLLLIMAVGYSAFSSKLDIKGSSMVTSKWDIEITDLQVKKTIGEVSDVSHSFDALNANMEANFYTPGDEITYEVTVSNLGTLDAVLDNIKINMASQDIIQFKVDGITSGSELKKGTSTKFDVIMKYNENITSQPNETTINFEMGLNYLQSGNSSNFSDADSDISDTLAITGIDITPSETSVKAEISANNAIKYYYSLDNDKWYETMDNMYTIYHLTPYTNYTMYIKAEDANGEVVFSSKEFTTLDNTKPEVKIVKGNNTAGENGWYKGLDLNIEAEDAGGIASSRYCVTSNDTCTASTDLALTDGKGTYQFASNPANQKLCVTVTDRKGNETVKCSENYKIDSEVPTLSKMTIEPLENTMTIVLEASDTDSGVYKYYYSKDSGQTYVESDSPNYTFTNLDSGDYFVTAYVKDEAGNISEPKAGSTAISATFCQENGIDNLSDCVIANETQEADIAVAKQTIEAKGTPDFTVTSPAIVYSENHATNTSTMFTTLYFYAANSYNFNSATGYYSLKSYKIVDPETINFNDGQTYYTCGGSFSSECTTLMKISDVNTTVNSEGTKAYTLTKYDYTARVNSYDNSTMGMYASSDDDGTSYYFRGAVSGNYVKMDDKYWRIIRVNGDGTLRLIYDGTSGHINGEASTNRQVGTSVFNNSVSDNAHVGYMYGDNTESVVSEANYSFLTGGFSQTTKYYFGTSYTFDEKSKSFKLSGDLIQVTPVEYYNKYNDDGYYTCESSSLETTCTKLWRVVQMNGNGFATLTPITYATTSYLKAHTNTLNSTIKTYVDNWYKNNLLDLANKLSSTSTFCNNRQLVDNTSTSGYGNVLSYYHGYDFIINSSNLVSLKCPLENDRFTASSSKGNGKLTYPVGLITGDEMIMSGGKANAQNVLYYLYTGTNYWTMTPSRFTNWALPHGVYVTYTGAVVHGTSSVGNSAGVRPVVNLDTTKVTFTGTGTMQDPYVIS